MANTHDDATFDPTTCSTCSSLADELPPHPNSAALHVFYERVEEHLRWCHPRVKPDVSHSSQLGSAPIVASSTRQPPSSEPTPSPLSAKLAASGSPPS